MNYTGQRYDDTGLLFYNARYYDPAIGRFISADTIIPGSGPLTVTPSDATAREMWGKSGNGAGNPQELNRYSYVNNNPIKYIDPTGHCIGPVIVICIAAGGAAATEAAAAVGGVLIGAFAVAGAWIAGDELRKAQAAAEEQSAIVDPSIPTHPDGKLTPRDKGFWKGRGVNPEKIKEPFVGSAGAGYDVYTDTKGNVWIKRKGAKDETGIYVGPLDEVLNDPTHVDDKVKEKNRGKDRGRDKRGEEDD